ncbi:MAG: M23 family metallopeptidase [Balneolaceae bacterium]|nr:M23 family metallopeptidase [Balneolaceae bacterium]
MLGNSFPDWPGDDGPEDPDDPWDPNPGGGSGTPCEDCGPGDEPLPPDEEPCGELGDDGCEDEDLMKPCEGNPVKNPRIAPQTNSGINGGRFGYTRSGGEQFHSGIDIVNDVGEPFYAMYGGAVVSVGYEPDGIGFYVTIQSFINGEYYTHQYGHLQKNGRPINGANINAGEIIGAQGLSGNLEGAVIRGMTVPHTHLVVRKRIGSGWNLKNDYSAPKNPEEIMTTQFNSLGNPKAETDC